MRPDDVSFNGATLSYDADGNLTSDGTNTYSWNARNQLTQISQGGTAQLSFAYDSLGRRTSKTVGGVATQFLYDGANALQETQGTTVNPILTGLGIDERFARNDVTGRTYFLTDALGSTIGLSDTTGALREQYSYDPYGNVTQSDTTTGFTNPYQYTGREADTAGLSYYRARYYSPMMGRFIAEDPMGFGSGQNNFYAYVGGDPLMYTDPFGLAAILGAGGSFGGGGASGSWDTPVLCEPIGSPTAARHGTSGLVIPGITAAGATAAAPSLWSAGLNGGDNSVFWSGYAQGARGIAEGLGGTTLESTPIGGALDYLSNTVGVPGLGPVWNAASATFAGNATGTATAVVLSEGATWSTIELPILTARAIPIVFFLP